MKIDTTTPEGAALKEYYFGKQIPQVGAPATMRVGSDTYAMIVTGVTPSGKTVRARRERDGQAQGEEMVFTLRKNGRYVLQRTPAAIRGITLNIGQAVTNLDRSF